jgi:uncharacterized membrane protein YhaH (DUF805 family)
MKRGDEAMLQVKRSVVMFESYKLYWKSYADFKGRASRRAFWWPVLCNGLIYAVMFVAAVKIPSLAAKEGASANIDTINFIIQAIFTCFLLATVIPNLSLAVRRLHDTGRRRFWVLILVVLFLPPAVLNIWLVTMICNGGAADINANFYALASIFVVWDALLFVGMLPFSLFVIGIGVWLMSRPSKAEDPVPANLPDGDDRREDERDQCCEEPEQPCRSL